MDFETFRAQQAAVHPQRLADIAAFGNRQVPTEFVSRALLSATCAGDIHHQQLLAKGLFSKAPYITPMEAAPTVLLSDWCKANNAPHRVIHDTRVVKVPATSPFTTSYAYETYPTAYAQLDEARIIPGWDYVLTPDRQVIADVAYTFINEVKHPKAFNNHANAFLPHLGASVFFSGKAEETIEGDVFFLSAPIRHHIGHWMVDFLPRLAAFEVAESSDSWKLAVPDDISEKQIESVVMMGFDESRILKLRRDTRYLCRRLHVLKCGNAQVPEPELVHFLRTQLCPVSNRPQPGKRIYLERGNIGTRLVANVAEVDSFLDAEGFIRADVAKLTMTEQQELLADAEVLLGSFGSALYSVYFAPAGSALISMIGERREDASLPSICYMIGVRHAALTCKGAPADAGKWWHKLEPDLLVDCAELRRRLSALTH